MNIEIAQRDLNLVCLALQENINDNINTEWWTSPYCGCVRREKLRAIWDSLSEIHLRSLEEELKKTL